MSPDPSLIVQEDVEGAPVRMGEAVKIVDGSEDGSIGRSFLGRTGVVVGLVYDDPVKQYPAHPLIRVRVRGLGEDLFFCEELEPASAVALRERPLSAGPSVESPATRGPGPV